MERTAVASSILKSIGYDPATQTLEIEFNHGGIYRYFGVPAEVYEGLLVAPSPGSYFHAHIRSAYPYTKAA